MLDLGIVVIKEVRRLAGYQNAPLRVKISALDGPVGGSVSH
jgi:hypothetical protein